MNIFAIYDPDTGAIGSVLVCNDPSLAAAQGAYLPCGPEVSDATHYVSNGEIVPKRKPEITHHIDGLSVWFTQLPLGTQVAIGGSAVGADTDGVVVEFDAPGTYEIRLYPPPQYTDELVEVVVG